MAAVRLLALTSFSYALGCTGTISDTSVQGLSPDEAAAQTAWVTDALPQFRGSTPPCVSCHDGSMASANPMPPGYLAGSNDLGIRDTLLAFSPPLVNLSAPKSSRVLSKGVHEGPALLADEYSGILMWIEAQAVATPPPPPIVIPMYTPMECTSGSAGTATCPINSIDLSVGGAPAGSTLSFVAQRTGSDWYLTQLLVKAGTSGGLQAVHPLFNFYASGSATPTPDPLDMYFNVDIDIMSGSANLGNGTTTFSGVYGDAMEIHFDKLGPYVTGG